MLVRVKNWQDHQHYRDRSPPWIKLHRDLLDDKDWWALPIASRALAPMLWLLASGTEDGTLDVSVEGLAFRLRMQPAEIKKALSPLVDSGWLVPVKGDASGVLADATSETETEAEGETEAELCPAEPDDPERMPMAKQVDLVWEAYLQARAAYYRDKNGSTPSAEPSLTTKRRTKIRNAIREHGYWKAHDAGLGIFWSDFHTGKNPDQKEFLTPEVIWSINTDRDNVERFAQRIAEERDRRQR